MANTLTSIQHKILARGLMTLREMAMMPQLVNSDYSRDAAERGDVINVPIPSAVSVIDVTPSNTHPAPSNSSFDTVQISLDQWKQNQPFGLSDKDLVEVDRNEHFVPMKVEEAIKALANDVNEDIHEKYVGIYGYTGTAATTPFGSGITEAAQMRKVLNEQLAPRRDRRIVLDHAAEANAVIRPEFSDVDRSSDRGPIIEGMIGRKLGFDWYADDAVMTHTAGTLTGDPVTTTTGALGAKQISLTCDSDDEIALLEGDIVTFAGDSQTYAVTADLTVGNSAAGILNIEPGLAVAQAGGEAIAVKASHVVNLAFHRDAFAYATRPLLANTQGFNFASQIASQMDPVTGLVLRLEVKRLHKQVVWEFDILWGSQLVRPELAVRLAG